MSGRSWAGADADSTTHHSSRQAREKVRIVTTGRQGLERSARVAPYKRKSDRRRAKRLAPIALRGALRIGLMARRERRMEGSRHDAWALRAVSKADREWAEDRLMSASRLL